MKNNNKINFLNIEKNNLWEINFQDPATPIAEHIIKIHNYVFFFLTIVLIFVAYNMYRILVSFWWIIPDNTEYSKKDLNILKSLSKIRFTHNTAIEIIWTLVPTLILIAIAIPSFGLLYSMDDVIEPDMTLKVVGHQWYWSYEYSDIKDWPDFAGFNRILTFDSYMLSVDDLLLGDSRLLEVDNPLLLPIGGYIRVNVTSADVLHCWAIPSLGIKIDAVPHRVNTGLIFLQRTGIFYGQCSEICGVNHGFMPIVIHSVTIDDFISSIKKIIIPIMNEVAATDPAYQKYTDNDFIKKTFAGKPDLLRKYIYEYYIHKGALIDNVDRRNYCLSEFEKLENGETDYDYDTWLEFFKNDVVVIQLLAHYENKTWIFDSKAMYNHKFHTDKVSVEQWYDIFEKLAKGR